MIIEPSFFNQFAYLIYGTTIIVLILTLFIGKEVAGAHSWIQFGSFSIQPAEFVKFSTGLALAHFLSKLETDLKNYKIILKASMFILIPIGIILLQNDTGSALVFLSFIFVFYRFGMSGNIFIIGVILAVVAILSLILNTFNQRLILIGVIVFIGIIAFYFTKRKLMNAFKVFGIISLIIITIFSVDFAFSKLKGYQQKRIKVLLNIEEDPYGTGYNINQSKIAIGSGGFSGKGFLNGTQTKYDFVPEQSTDFIFCTIGEEHGFIGSFVVLSLYIGLFLRLIFLAERQRSRFSKIYGYCVMSILLFHFLINIGMVIGLLPVIGIPLPFISYGGSSIWAFSVLLFIFVRQDAERVSLL
jgi:rod shape determining protein RodA